MNIAKYDLSSCQGLLLHFAREGTPSNDEHKRSNIDESKTHLNYNLAPEREESQLDYIKEKLETIDHVQRKTLVVMASLIIDQPKEVGPDSSSEFFRQAYSFCVERYGNKSGLGEDCIISSYVHLDESTPHMHVAILPVVRRTEEVEIIKDGTAIKIEQEKQRFCAKEFINKHELDTLHKDMDKWLEKHGINAKTSNGKTIYGTNGRPLTVKQLKRLDQRKITRWEQRDNGAMNRGRW